MRLTASLFLVSSILAFAAIPIHAQGRSEVAFSVGGGSLRVDPGGGSTPVFSFSYRFHITNHFSAEGALDFFYYKFLSGAPEAQSPYRDDYAGAEAAVVYHFHAYRETRRFIPFLAAGIGKTTTDFTEIPGTRYWRFGVGADYNLTDRWGIRIEARDEIIDRLYIFGAPKGNLPSIRAGIVLRF